MHLKNPLLFGLMAIILLGGTITPVLSQTNPDTSIVINEVEMNPLGSDAGLGDSESGISSKSVDGPSGSQEYVELFNPTSQSVDISGWSIIPTATWKKYTIPDNTILDAESFLMFTHVNYWFKDFGESISLYDAAGNLIDETPLLKDQDDDSTSWQRITDGLDTGSVNDWELKRITPKSSNGIITQNEVSVFVLTGQTDKPNYVLGDELVISGTVSETLYSNSLTSEIIKISITGPNYYTNLALFPDKDLNFSTTFLLQSVLGFNTGNYDVKISYGDNSVNTNFIVVSELSSTQDVPQNDSEFLEIFTERESYIPGETVILFADTNSAIEYGGLEYIVTNPNGETSYSGSIFPNSEFSIVYQQGGGQIYPFSSQMYLSPVNPVFGTYEINAIFKHQNSFSQDNNSLSAKTFFTLVEDVKEDVPISLSTDKSLYSVGDVVKVTGRSNDVWVEDLELRVLQTSILTSDAVGSDSRYVAPDPFDLRDRVRLNGDGTFEYEFKLVEAITAGENYAQSYGDYKIIISEYFGDAIVNFKVVEDPESFSDVRTPLGLKLDKSQFVLGTPLKISGTLMDYQHVQTNNLRNTIDITIKDGNGKVLTYFDHQGSPQGTNCNTNDCAQFLKPLVYTALPDQVGAFSIDLVLLPGQFDYGTYQIIGKHSFSGNSESIEFEIISAQNEIISVDETRAPLTLNLEKDVYYVGEKLNISGNVILKDPRSLDQSSTNPSGSTQFGSSYTTNYAQAALNYVEVTIPYPKSMKIVKSSNYQTVPDSDENYTGGGGTGAGGSYYEDKDGNIVRGDEDKKQSSKDRQTGYDGQAILKKQKLMLTDMGFKAYPDENGDFSGVFDLRAGIFATGVYSIKANYYGHYIEDTVQIIDNSLKGGDPPRTVFEIDKSEYVPGETVRISGLIENAYYYDMVSMIVETPDTNDVSCQIGQQCGYGNTEQKQRVKETIEGPKFFFNYKIPEHQNALGTYNIVVDTHFGKTEKQFFVIPESETIGKPTSDSSLGTKKIIAKFNRISDTEIPITLGEKSSEESTLVPRVLQGSLFTSARGEESDVNLRITTSGGQCVVGQASDCLVTESTRKPGAIYSIVSIDDIDYKIRYSGNDVRLEKFSIVPQDPNSKLDIDTWNIEIEKDEQPSRFYYKVSYVILE